MDLKILGIAKDQRTNTPVVYAQTTIKDYLQLIGDDCDTFLIQRGRVKHKAYARMKNDLIEGALLPSITLAVKPEFVETLLPLVKRRNLSELADSLGKPGSVNILDGLQRTYILKELQNDRIEFKAEQTIHLEFWLESEMRHLIYRMIVLNAGQKPMSMRHQIELLFMTLKDVDINVYGEDDVQLGVLCLTTRYEFVELSELSDWEFVAYITEVPKEEYNQPYRFQSDYLVLKIGHYAEYVEHYLESAPIWGGFVHSDVPAGTEVDPMRFFQSDPWKSVQLRVATRVLSALSAFYLPRF
jgi:hypothetical protein